MTQKYFKYRYTHFNMGQGNYSLSYIYNQNRSWFVENGVVNIKDMLIPDDKYKNASRGKRFGIVEFDETKITPEEMEFDLNHDYSIFAYKTLTSAEATNFLDNHTKLVKDANGYLLSAESTFGGVTTPAVYLNIV